MEGITTRPGFGLILLLHCVCSILTWENTHWRCCNPWTLFPSILTNLINEITAFPDHFSLVLDDYQASRTRAIQEALFFSIEHMPPQVHLVLISRTEPSLPLARPRASRDLFLLLFTLTIYGIAEQIFLPYLIIYLNHYLELPTLQASSLIFVCILVGGILLAYPFGLLADRLGRKRLAVGAILLKLVGLILFSLMSDIPLLALTGILWLVCRPG